MKIILIHGSPKPKNSASACLLADLKACLPETASLTELSLSRPILPETAAAALKSAEAWVFAFPLYVDGIPSHLLSCLLQMEESPNLCLGKSIYALVNCGFYEGSQGEPALAILQNWCKKSGACWKGGLGVGGGGAIGALPKPPWGKGPCASIHQALKSLAEGMMEGRALENAYATLVFPRFLYRLAGQMGWRQMIKANGGRAKDLGRRIP